jgi:protein FRA10AC1
MVHHYHEQLYKDYVLADLTRASNKQIGLRWRTQTEVQAWKGSESCGNKHCPSHQQETTIDGEFEREALSTYLEGDSLAQAEREERALLKKLPYGILLTNFEVPFTYPEDNQNKTELVKLRLCARCTPRLFVSKGEASPFIAARRARLNKSDEVVSNENLATVASATSTDNTEGVDRKSSKK